MNFWKDLKKPFSVLAPMEDVTDIAFRTVIKEIGRPDVFFTEFTNADGMASRGREKVITRLRYDQSENPIVAQIWGLKPENYMLAARDVAEMGFAGVDINMGCPVKKIVKNGACSALIDNPSLASEIIHATIEGAAGKIPVSVKTRIGFKTKKTEEWATHLLSHDIQALTIHGRVAKHMSKFPCDWDEIGKVASIRNEINPDIVVIGNGDVERYEEIQEKHEKYGVDGVMIGRGVFKDPMIFNPNRSFNDIEIEEKLKILLRHVELFTKEWGDEKNFLILRRFLKIYANGFDGAGALREKLMNSENKEEVVEMVDEFLKEVPST